MKQKYTLRYSRKARTEERTNDSKESSMRAFTNSLPIFSMLVYVVTCLPIGKRICRP